MIGPGTEIVAGAGRILTAGGVDCHVHFISPPIVDEALGSGITTLIGGGTGPAEGTKATTVTPGDFALARMHAALDECPVNVVLLGKGNTASEEALWEQLAGGAAGFKLHEDWGSTPVAIDRCLRVADASGVQVAIHTDTLNETGFLESTLEAIGERTIHTYHTEGAGGGHAPDIIRVASFANVLPSSTNPTRPHTVNTIAEHLDMLMVCHHLNPRVPEDLAFAESRIRDTTIAAEDILHDLGAISMIGSDSQAMGRAGETILRTWQTAHAVRRTGSGGIGDGPADNARARRYVAKYTICPAVAHGLAGDVGSVEVGKLADLVLWEPRFFAVRPHLVLKGGVIAWAQVGDANASIPTPQPVFGRPMFAGAGRAAAESSITYLAAAAFEAGVPERLGLRRTGGPTRFDAGARKGRPPREHRDARDPRRAGQLSCLDRRRGGRTAARSRPSPRPALLPLLVPSLPLLLLSDGRFPGGGYGHSGGLEPAILDDLGVADVRAFLVDRLSAVGFPEAVLMVAAMREPDIQALLQLDGEAVARLPGPPLRAASRRLGSQLLRSATGIWPEHGRIAEYRAASSATPRPVAFGVVARALDLSEHEAATVYLYEEAITVAQAAVRLLPVDASEALRWVAASAEIVEELAVEAAAWRGSADRLPATFAPALELRSLDHSRREGRLFAT